MNRLLLLLAAILFSNNAATDSFRCGRKLVKQGDSSSILVKKCGRPERKFSSREPITNQGRQSMVAVSNWVYERNGKKDMIVSVRSGTIIKVEVD